MNGYFYLNFLSFYLKLDLLIFIKEKILNCQNFDLLEAKVLAEPYRKISTNFEKEIFKNFKFISFTLHFKLQNREEQTSKMDKQQQKKILNSSIEMKLKTFTFSPIRGVGKNKTFATMLDYKKTQNSSPGKGDALLKRIG